MGLSETGPRRCDLLLTGGRVVAGGPVIAGQRDVEVIDDGAIAITGDTIVAAGPSSTLMGEWLPARTIDVAGQTVLPGFVDAHVHAASFLFAHRPYQPSTGPSMFSGGGDIGLILPMVARFCTMDIDPELTYAAALPAFAAMLRAGFTGVVDAGGCGAEGVLRAAEDIGIRAAVGPSLADVWTDGPGEELTRQLDTDKVLAAAAEFVGRSRKGGCGQEGGRGRVQAIVSAADTIMCSDELLAGIASISRDHDRPTHIHAGVTANTGPSHWHQGRAEIDRVDEAGMLGPDCTVMHLNFVTDAEVARIAATGTTMNHNPMGNALLGFGTARARAVPRLLAAEVPVVLGSDTAPTVPSPFELMRAALMLHRDVAQDDSVVTLEQVLGMSSNGGASLGQPGRLGRLAAGYLADIVVVDTTKASYLYHRHPVPAVTLQGQSRDVTTVIVAGEVMVADGELVKADQAELIERAERAMEIAFS